MIFPEDIDDEFPEDEWDYYLKLLNEIHRVGHEMIECTDPEQKIGLTEHYIKLQQWLEELQPTNAWYGD